jgi:hypothetical protein
MSQLTDQIETNQRVTGNVSQRESGRLQQASVSRDGLYRALDSPTCEKQQPHTSFVTEVTDKLKPRRQGDCRGQCTAVTVTSSRRLFIIYFLSVALQL